MFTLTQYMGMGMGMVMGMGMGMGMGPYGTLPEKGFPFVWPYDRSQGGG